MILIYNDEGVSQDSVNGLLSVFSELKKDARVVNAITLSQSNWLSETEMLVMPGGRSKPFYEKLKGAGNQNIVTFVKRGGTYLGLCAGAYYACRETVFAEGLPLALCLPGELNFFAGCAIGPAFLAAEFAYQTEKGASFVNIVDDSDNHYSVYFNGGCYFESENPLNCHIYAWYVDNKKPAIISSTVGAGRAILCGIHPELSQDDCARKELLIKIMA